MPTCPWNRVVIYKYVWTPAGPVSAWFLFLINALCRSVALWGCLVRFFPIHYLSLLLFSYQLYGYTALHVACFYDQQRVVVELLKKFSASGINIQDNVSVVKQEFMKPCDVKWWTSWTLLYALLVEPRCVLTLQRCNSWYSIALTTPVCKYLTLINTY